jgi:hypothetical protein
MYVTELDTFIQKFHQLWNSGHTAHLDLETCAGKAWVGLRVQLGHGPGPPHEQLHHPPFHHPKQRDSPSRMRRRARRAANRQQQERVIQEVNAEAEPKPSENVIEVKTAETVDAEKVLSEESGIGTTPKSVEETEDKINQKDEEEINEIVEETDHDEADKIETQETALKEVADEICSDVDYVAKQPNVIKSQYPRHCEECNRYLRNNTEFRKHVVACVMSRKGANGIG